MRKNATGKMPCATQDGKFKSTVSCISIVICRNRIECHATNPHIKEANPSTIMPGTCVYRSVMKCESMSILRCCLLRAAATDPISAIQRTIILSNSSAHIRLELKNRRKIIWPTANTINVPNNSTNDAFSAAVPQRSKRLINSDIGLVIIVFYLTRPAH